MSPDHHDSSKTHTPLGPPPCSLVPAGDIYIKFTKWFVFVFLLSSICFVVFSSYSNQSPWPRCPVCFESNEHPEKTIFAHHHHHHPIPAATNISHIVFGIGGSVKTWKDRRRYAQLWWSPDATRGYVWLEQEPNKSTWPPYRVSEPTSGFRDGSRPAIRISRIVAESYRLGLKDVRWFVMGDDDTVFFPDNLVTVLSKYDHNQMYYIGANSESVEQDVMHSYGMAFGGGGFAISYSLAEQLSRSLDGCIDRYWNLYGSDQRIEVCTSEIGVPLTKNLGFHQLDIRGNPYGLLAAHPLTPLVSLHHLEAVAPLFPNRTRMDSLRLLYEAYAVDPGRTLQQSFCHDLQRNWSISISWGYTVQIYPSLLNAKVLETAVDTFKTWRSWGNAPFTFNTRPISSDPCERPLAYFLDRIDGLGKGTLTTYRRFVGETGLDCDRAAHAVHKVMVSSLKMDPDDWKKATRRQCSEVVNRIDKGESSVHVRIRKCKPWESVTSRP